MEAKTAMQQAIHKIEEFQGLSTAVGDYAEGHSDALDAAINLLKSLLPSEHQQVIDEIKAHVEKVIESAYVESNGNTHFVKFRSVEINLKDR